MFRSASNIRCLSYDNDDEPAGWLSMAARGIHDDGMTSFFTTNIPHDDDFIPENPICGYSALKDNLNNNNPTQLSYRAKIYAVSEDSPTINHQTKEIKEDNVRKKLDLKKIKISKSLERIELKGNKHRIQVKGRKVRSFDSSIDITSDAADKR